MKKKPSYIFAPYKSLGVHTTAVRPVFHSNTNNKKPYISLFCPISNQLAEYNASKLRKIAVSDCLPADITVVAARTRIASQKCSIFVAAGQAIYCMTFCRSVEQVIALKCEVKHMLVLGDQLILVDTENGLRVVDCESGEETLHLEGSDTFKVTSMIHPATYINKIVLGSADGSLRIVNIRTGKVVHQFTKLVNGSIDVLEQTPVVDMLALGLSNGLVTLHNIKTDEQIMSFRHDRAISAIGFRTDGLPMMTTADSSGHIAVWDLEKQELAGKIGSVHKSAVTQLYFFQSEPIMVSCSVDNSIRVWILDSGDSLPRQLNVLEGHAEPASAVTFSSQFEIITASLDGSIRKHSVVANSMRCKLGDAGIMSKAKAKKQKRAVETIRLDPVVDISIGLTREAAWDNILCRHSDSLPVSTWTSRKTTMGRHQLVHPRFTTDSAMFHATATATCVSPCGNFAYIGYSTGHLDQFNIQSGRLMRSFGEETTLEDGKEVKIGKAHTAAVTALAVDVRGSELVSGSSAGELKFWDVRKGKCTTTMRTKLRIRGCVQSPASNLIAVSCTEDNGPSVAVIDTLCRHVVRSFKQVGNELNAMAFSSDGKWLLTADNDCYVRVWELSTSKLIDVMLFAKPCIGLSFNESGQYLATIHKGEKSVEVWANKKLFAAQLNIKALPIDFKPTWELSIENDYKTALNDEASEEEDAMESDERFDAELISYSGLPPSRWANLADLALIRERNKPTEPVRKPKQAPFFLTAAATLEGFEFDVPKDEDTEEQRKNIQAKRSLLELESSFTSSLRRAQTIPEYLAVFEQLKRMSLSSIDFQIRSLPVDVLSQFLKTLLEVVKTRTDFDLVQSYLAACIKIHRAELWSSETEDKDVARLMDELSHECDRAWQPLDDVLIDNAAVIQWIKNALI